MESVIKTVELTKTFKDFWRRDRVRAVDHLNLSVNRGEVFGLLGPNGSGKTTTIKLILGLLFPTSGGVRIFGMPPGNISLKSRIGFLPEESYLYKYLNATETMSFYGRLFGLSALERSKRTKKLLGMVNLSASANRPVGEYSKGMARRIGIAQALINDPDLVIMDEPTSGLDPIGRREVKDIILELKELGKTVVLSSHLLAEVEDVCDRIAILYAGKLIAEGNVGEILARKDAAGILVSGISSDAVKKFVESMGGKAEVDTKAQMEPLEEYFLETIRRLELKEAEKRKAEEKIEVHDEKQSIIEKLTNPKM